MPTAVSTYPGRKGTVLVSAGRVLARDERRRNPRLSSLCLCDRRPFDRRDHGPRRDQELAARYRATEPGRRHDCAVDREEVYAVALLGPAARASARRRVYPAAAILGDIEGATAWSQYPPARVIAAGPPVFSLVPAFSVIDGLLGGSRLSAPEAMQLLKTAGSRITSSQPLKR